MLNAAIVSSTKEGLLFFSYSAYRENFILIFPLNDLKISFCWKQIYLASDCVSCKTQLKFYLMKCVS